MTHDTICVLTQLIHAFKGSGKEEVMITIDYKDPRPLYEQVAEKMKNLIIKGILEADSKMPSVRSLALELSINPNTIQKAYEKLEQMGYLYVIKGRGNFVSYQEDLLIIRKQELLETLGRLVKEAMEYGVTKEELLEYLERNGGGL